MKAILHIGTEKTGTTSIQEFLSLNADTLSNQGIKFIDSLGKNHIFLKTLAIEPDKQDSHNLIYGLDTKQKLLERKKYLYKTLKKHIKEGYDFIFSSELLQSRLDSIKELRRLRYILKILGFKEISVIIYLREQASLLNSLYSESLKWEEYDKPFIDNDSLDNDMQYKNGYKKNINHFFHICNHKNTLQCWGEVFGKENLIVRIFDKNEFYNKDLLQDFIHALGIAWSDEYRIPQRQNETLDLLGMEIMRGLNPLIPFIKDNKINPLRNKLLPFFDRHFTSKDSNLAFRPPQKAYQSYIDYFKESNEWVRERFFPHRAVLFENHEREYNENYKLTQMNEKYWEKIAAFIADLINTHEKLKKYQEFLRIGTAQDRVKNELEYKIGTAILRYSGSISGCIKMPFIISYIKARHKQKQDEYNKKVQANPDLALPPLEFYPDYEEGLREKESLAYKVGQSYLSRTTGGGGADHEFSALRVA